MFIGRREDGTIYGLWTVRQWGGQQELPEDHPEVVAFNAALVRPQKQEVVETALSPIVEGEKE